MGYEPIEGVDYLVDYYAVAGVEQGAESTELKTALNTRLREYHPDRLQGLAPEFLEKGQRMARLLNVAKVILLDEAKRTEYDDILSSWDGPTSKDGTPVIRIDDAMRGEARLRSVAELEAAFNKQHKDAEVMVGYSAKQHSLLQRLFDDAEGADKEEFRELLDEALLAKDRVLAIEEADRSQLIGLETHKRFEMKYGYEAVVDTAIEGVRASLAADHTRRQLGGVGVRLALMSGQTPGPTLTSLAEAGPALPHYFDAQAEKIVSLAAQREDLLEDRLALFDPEYPVPQTFGHDRFVIGYAANTDDPEYGWAGFEYYTRFTSLENVDIDPSIKELLDSGNFQAVYEAGYNVLRFKLKEQIDAHTLLEAAVNKHIEKFFPVPDSED